MLKLAKRTRGHFVTLIEIRVHLIRVKPRLSFHNQSPLLTMISVTVLVKKAKFENSNILLYSQNEKRYGA